MCTVDRVGWLDVHGLKPSPIIDDLGIYRSRGLLGTEVGFTTLEGMDPAEMSSEAYLRRDGGRFGAVPKGSLNGHFVMMNGTVNAKP